MRYFIICYGMKGKYMGFGNGQMAMSCNNYPKYSEIKRIVDESTNDDNSINVTNIVELNKDDYDSFNS